MQITELLAKWDTGDGKPYKGSLIDWAAYEADPNTLGCMCAQGQVLHSIAGWSPEKLRDTEQQEADAATAKLLNISVAHAILLRNVNDSIDGAPSIVLTDPGKVLGSEWGKLLDFWWHLDQMTVEQWAAARDAARDAARGAAGDAARDAAWGAAWDAAGDAAWGAAWDAARDAARDAAWAAGDAANEIQGAHLLRERGRPFSFLPMFGFASPEDIPARPVNYGGVA